jgi:two-component system, chemotaxis family, sensor kinase CheA
MSEMLDPVATFRVEAGELLDRIEQALLDLDADLGDKGLIDEVFRGLHTVKGSGAMFGFDALAAFTHHCESAFDRVRKGEVALSQGLVAVVLAAQDHMRSLIEDGAAAHGDAGAVILARLEAALNAPGGAAPAAEAPRLWRIRFALPPKAMANGTNPLSLLAELRSLGDCQIVADTSAIPPLDDLDPVECFVRWDVSLRTTCKREAIEDVFLFLIDDMQLDISCEDDPPVSLQPAGAAVAEGSAANADVTPGAQQAASTGAGKAGESVRVPAERLDELMDRVGELVIAQSRLSQLAAQTHDLNLRAVSEDIERLSNELRDTMMVLRMVPVGTLFGRFRRLVHDLARETGKTIELTTEGEATEVDKTVIERLADPLVHLVRNAVDHGLEPPEERLASGKQAAGRVVLAARQAGGEVIITISDDGRGINRDRVRAKAEAQGLIPAGATVSDSELLGMIFQPGFSTAATVTSLSGRGVGMDVVKRTIDGLRGAIDIRSTPGDGSEVALRIPLTLAIIDGLLVRVGSGRFVIPLAAVEECIELSLEDDLRSRGRSFISLRDALVPFLRLREVFRTGTKPEPFQKVVVVSTGTDRVGLVVDQIIGDHQTVIKAMSKLHEDVTMFSGATILGDGSVALILDVAHLVVQGQMQEAQMRAAG